MNKFYFEDKELCLDNFKVIGLYSTKQLSFETHVTLEDNYHTLKVISENAEKEIREIIFFNLKKLDNLNYSYEKFSETPFK